jgi:hypothetical protein
MHELETREREREENKFVSFKLAGIRLKISIGKKSQSYSVRRSFSLIR